MKKQLIVLVIVLLPFFLFSQVRFSRDFKVTKGKPYKVIDANMKRYFTVDENYLFSVKVHGEYATIQTFDANSMSEVARNEYKDFPKYSKLQSVLEIGGNWYYFFEAFNKKQDNFTLYYRVINPNDASLGKINKLFTTNNVVVGTLRDAWDENTFAFPGVKLGPKFIPLLSYDKSKLMITYRNKPKVKNDDKNKDIIGVYMYDTQLNELWSKEVEMPYTEAEINNLGYGTTANGTAFMLILNRELEKYSVLVLNANEELREMDLNINNDKAIYDFKFIENSKGNMVFAGFYANGIDFKVSWYGAGATSLNINGILYFELDTKGNLISEHDIPFSIDLIKKYQSKRKKKKSDKRENSGNAGIEDLRLIDFYTGEGGNLYFVGEQRFARMEYEYNTMKGKSQSKMVNYYNDLVIAKVIDNGSLDWINKLPKEQKGQNRRGMLGVKYMKAKGNHFFLFMDDEDNSNLSVNDTPELYADGEKNGVLSCYIINDATGEFKRHNILQLNNIKGIKAYQFTTARIFNLSENEVMFEVYIKNKKDMMIKLELLE